MSQEENESFCGHIEDEIFKLSKIDPKLLFEPGSGFFEEDKVN